MTWGNVLPDPFAARLKKGSESFPFVIPFLAGLATSLYLVIAEPVGRQILRDDGALFLYGGLRWANGYLPYKTLFDVKPPGVYFQTLALAQLFGPDRMHLYVGSIALNILILSTSLALIGGIVSRATGDLRIGLIVGLLPLTLATTVNWLAVGPMVKASGTLALLFGMYATIAKRPLLAGTGIVAAPLFYQPLLFPAIVVLMEWEHRPRKSQYHLLGAAGVTLLFAVLPFIVGGALPHLIVQTIIFHFISGSVTADVTIRGLIQAVGFGVGRLWILPAMGLIGSAWWAFQKDTAHAYWPLAPFAAWFMFIVDLESSLDSYPFVMLSIIGVGFLAVKLNENSNTRLWGGVALVLLFLGWWNGDGTTYNIFWMVRNPEFTTQYYWSGELSHGCHLHLKAARGLRSWLEVPGVVKSDGQCGGWQVIKALKKANGY